VIDGQSYLLLICDEGGPPQVEFIHWVDAVVFVFSLENEESFTTAREYYLKIIPYRTYMNDITFILVGTQDFISENNPGITDDT
jgi:Arf-GAP/GTPase/ANK repeat/PH domain-containing protein 1/3